MTDRIHSLTVVLSQNTRDDDAQLLIDAILMLRGVQNVSTHVADPTSFMAEIRAKHELGQKILDVLYTK